MNEALNEKRKTKSEKRQSVAADRFSFFVFRFSLPVLLLVGCSSNAPTTRPVTATDRQNEALRDPFAYSPDFGSSNEISGGDVKQYDHNAMKKDIDHVLNP